MRVLAIADGFSVANEPFMVATVMALVERGHQVCVVGSEPGWRLEPGDRRRVGRAVRLFPRGTPGLRGRLRGAWLLQRARLRDGERLSRMLAAVRRQHGPGATLRMGPRLAPLICEDFDVVHFMAANDVALYAAVIDMIPQPTIVSCTGSDVRVLPLANRWFRRSLPVVLGKANRVLCVSRELSAWAHRVGAPEERTEVLHHGVDTAFFSPSGTRRRSAGGPLRLVSVARLNWIKGHDYAVQAVALLRDRGVDVRFTIAGQDEGALEPVEYAISQLRLDDVHVRGQLSAEDVRGVLAGSDVFVLASVSEGICMAAVEAMAMGLPVVTTDVGGMRELIDDGVHGFVVPPRQPEALADAIAKLAADPELRAAMGRAGMERAREHFDVTRFVDRLEEIYLEVTKA
ncbi:MAG TPA: glycosyltransferase family 4 protein [Acidimicrobiales bacterium]|nr:glycosyltransferase family 4 protein [Acidimicrobiales bacterium]